MLSLAKHCVLVKDKVVCGSDIKVKKKRYILDGKILVCGGKNLKSIKAFKPDLVVYSSAISINSRELMFAQKNKIEVCKRSQLLNAIINEYKNSIAISGCHGKTTVTSMVANVLACADKKFTAFIGGEDNLLGSYYNCGSDFAVLEACEFKKNFLDIRASVSVVLNIDDDHQDSFIDMDDRIKSFSTFAASGVCIFNNDDINCQNLTVKNAVTYGINKKSKYTAKNLKENENGGYTFSVYDENNKMGEISLKVNGKHNVYNALCTFAVCNHLQIPFNFIKSGLENFLNVKRRMECMGMFYDKRVYCDYAHHPTELKCAMESISNFSSTDLFIFQPHTYSRTKSLLNDFVNVLSFCPNLILYKTYPARECFDSKGSAKYLYKCLKKENNNNVLYLSNVKKLKRVLQEKGVYNRVFVFGAGDLYDVVKKMINKL